MIEFKPLSEGQVLDFYPAATQECVHIDRLTPRVRQVYQLLHAGIDRIELSGPSKPLVNVYFTSPFSFPIVQIIAGEGEYGDYYNDKPLNTLTEDFAGKLFEDAAYLYLQAGLRQNRSSWGRKLRLTTSAETHDFYRRFFPTYEVIANRPFFQSILGVYQPDGLILRKTRRRWVMVGAVESKAGREDFDGLPDCRRHTRRNFRKLNVTAVHEFTDPTFEGREVCAISNPELLVVSPWNLILPSSVHGIAHPFSTGELRRITTFLGNLHLRLRRGGIADNF